MPLSSSQYGYKNYINDKARLFQQPRFVNP